MTNSRRNLSRPGIIDVRTRYRAAARRLRNTALDDLSDLPIQKDLSLLCQKLSKTN